MRPRPSYIFSADSSHMHVVRLGQALPATTGATFPRACNAARCASVLPSRVIRSRICFIVSRFFLSKVGAGDAPPNPALKRDVPAMKLPARPLALRSASSAYQEPRIYTGQRPQEFVE